jgi:Spy/CpxP family protein refolding chaperone
MNARRVAAATILLSAMVFAQTAQTTLRAAPGSRPAMPEQDSAFSKLMLPEKLGDAAGFFNEFWKDPEISAALKLTDSQRQQLQQESTAQQLLLIDDGANLMKSFVRLSAILDAEPFDEAAYNKEAGALAATTGKTVESLAEMVAFRRRILTGEQYAKLRALQKERSRKARQRREAERWKMNQQMQRRGPAQPRIPSSLDQPMR